jgi:hypothetical protein
MKIEAGGDYCSISRSSNSRVASVLFRTKIDTITRGGQKCEVFKIFELLSNKLFLIFQMFRLMLTYVPERGTRI